MHASAASVECVAGKGSPTRGGRRAKEREESEAELGSCHCRSAQPPLLRRSRAAGGSCFGLCLLLLLELLLWLLVGFVLLLVDLALCLNFCICFYFSFCFLLLPSACVFACVDFYVHLNFF
ncbi:uncharacterized protein DS421_13g408040 [Arachis hypogaea]|nr:uncharacterized protein DS421_13g408040 [Arachis hypogaea]